MEVAAEHAEAHCKGSRQRVEKRLFLDRIELQAADISVGYKEFAAAVEPDPADAIKPVENDATVAARETAQLAVLEFFVENALLGIGFEDAL